jgi:hypothetical protein
LSAAGPWHKKKRGWSAGHNVGPFEHKKPKSAMQLHTNAQQVFHHPPPLCLTCATRGPLVDGATRRSAKWKHNDTLCWLTPLACDRAHSFNDENTTTDFPTCSVPEGCSADQEKQRAGRNKRPPTGRILPLIADRQLAEIRSSVTHTPLMSNQSAVTHSQSAATARLVDQFYNGSIYQDGRGDP